MPDQRQRAGHLRRERDEDDAPPAASWRRVKSSTLAGRDVLARMRAARAVLRRQYGPSMWMPAIAGSEIRARIRAFAAKRSNGEVMSVGRQRVTPVARMRSSASATRSAVRPGR